MKHSYGKDMAYNSSKAEEVISYVQAHDIELCFSCEDTFRPNLDNIFKLYWTIDRLGVKLRWNRRYGRVCPPNGSLQVCRKPSTEP